jgi:hypothetical protein
MVLSLLAFPVPPSNVQLESVVTSVRDARMRRLLDLSAVEVRLIGMFLRFPNIERLN